MTAHKAIPLTAVIIALTTSILITAFSFRCIDNNTVTNTLSTLLDSATVAIVVLALCITMAMMLPRILSSVSPASSVSIVSHDLHRNWMACYAPHLASLTTYLSSFISTSRIYYSLIMASFTTLLITPIVHDNPHGSNANDPHANDPHANDSNGVPISLPEEGKKEKKTRVRKAPVVIPLEDGSLPEVTPKKSRARKVPVVTPSEDGSVPEVAPKKPRVRKAPVVTPLEDGSLPEIAPKKPRVRKAPAVTPPTPLEDGSLPEVTPKKPRAKRIKSALPAPVASELTDLHL